MPGGRFGATNSPVALVYAFVATLVASFVTVTLALEMTADELSLIVPRIVPVMFCATASCTKTAAKTTASRLKHFLMIAPLHSCAAINFRASGQYTSPDVMLPREGLFMQPINRR